MSHAFPIRKAAILVSSLDTASADALLEQMGPELAARVRAAVLDMDEIDPAEQARIVDEFLGRSNSRQIIASDLVDVEGVEFTPSLQSKFMAVESSTASAPKAPETSRLLQRLERVPTAELATALQGEHPQTTAVVLAHVAPSQAAEILAQLPEGLQTDVVRRIFSLDVVDAETLGELEAALIQRLTGSNRRSVSNVGKAAISEILSAAAQQQRHELLRNLERRHQRLADELGFSKSSTTVVPQKSPPEVSEKNHNIKSLADLPRPPLNFDALGQLSDEALQLVLTATSPRTVLLALAGASDALMQRIYSRLPANDARALRRNIEQQGPIRLRDIDEAQQSIAAVAKAFAENGKLNSPPDWPILAIV